jgi:hypothetical protein
LCALAQTHLIPTLDRPNDWTGVNSYTQSPQVPEPVNHADAVPKDYVDSHVSVDAPWVFDCTNTKYAGGCLGSTPGLAMQALANDITCYQSMTGLRPNVIFPPGTIAIGTAANPTLVFPTGAHYASASPNPNGVATTFQATYNGHLALHFMIAVSATRSDGNVHTNTLNAATTAAALVFMAALRAAVSMCPAIPITIPWADRTRTPS